jgi:thiol-disulfide isomerase/thioredoxin
MKEQTIRSCNAWLMVAFSLVLVLIPRMTLAAESARPVGTIDSAGIEKLIKDKGPTIIVGMAAWCFPCRQELPTLIKLYDKFRKEGLNVVGISVDISGPEAIQPVVDEERVNFPVYWGGEQAIKDLKITRLPMLLFAKEGAIVDTFVGRQPEEVLDQRIRDFLK